MSTPNENDRPASLDDNFPLDEYDDVGEVPLSEEEEGEYDDMEDFDSQYDGDDIEEMLAGGADVDSLIMGGYLDVDDPDDPRWGYNIPSEPEDYTEEDVDRLFASIEQKQQERDRASGQPN